MRNRIALTVMFLAAAAAPALAGPANGVAGLPEPASMTLFGIGIGGAYLAKKFINRK